MRRRFNRINRRHRLQEGILSLKDFTKVKNKMYIPLGIFTNNSTLISPHLTIQVGFELNETMRFPYDRFDLVIANNQVYLFLTRHGIRHIKVNTKHDSNLLDKLVTKITQITKDVLKRTKYYET